MKIFTRNSDRQIRKEIAPISARAEISDNIRIEKAKLTNRNIQDKAQVKKNLNQWESLYDKKKPEVLSIDAKNTLWKRAKSLKDDFTIGMLSKDELHPVKMFEMNGTIKTVVDEDKMRDINSVKRQKAWDQKNESKVREFKNIMRHLDPDNPNAGDIERFRPTGRIK